jgi:hypothetical protein
MCYQATAVTQPSIYTTFAQSSSTFLALLLGWQLSK